MLYLIGSNQWGILIAAAAVAGGILYYRNSPGYKGSQRRALIQQAFAEAMAAPEYQREALLQQLLAADPEHVDAIVNLALIKSRQADWNECGALCRSALQLQPNNFFAAWILGEVFLNQQLPDDGVPLLEGLLTREDLTLARRMDVSEEVATGYRMIGDPVSALKIMHAVDVSDAPRDERLRSWMIARAVVKYSAGDEPSALADLGWVQQAWPGAGGVATMKVRMSSGELRDVVGTNRPKPSAAVTHCPVCGAPRRAAGVVICHFCSTAF